MIQTKRFTDRSVFITGAGSGIGLATALAFAAEGARVTIAELDEFAGNTAVARIRDRGGQALFVKTDATNEHSVKAAIDAACNAHGSIMHVFNNVGAPRGSTIDDTSLEEWEWALRMCLTSTFLAMKHEIPVMREAGGGTIVNCASNTVAVFTSAAPPAYCAAKAAVINLSHYGSCALGKDKIRVNSVSPGLTATPLVIGHLTPQQHHDITSSTQVIPRLTQPEEIAAAVLYLSSDEAAMITGIDLEVGGGRLF